MGTVGLMIGGATLLAAARAAHWAKEAAEHTKRSANTAADALIADTRAWLAIKAVSPHVRGDTLDDDSQTISSRITLGVHNYGRGPALDCELQVGWKRRGEVWEKVEHAPYCRSVQFDALMPDEGNPNIVVQLDDPVAEVFLNGMLMLWVEVSYRVVGTDGRRRTIQQLNVGGATRDGIQPIGKGYLVRGHKLAAVPVKTRMT